MSHHHPTSHPIAHTPHALTPAIVMMMAAGAGLSVASIYYSQPMLGILGVEMQAGADTIGLVPTLTQMGYALGILLLAPLGDRHDRRRIILAKGALLALALLLSGCAPAISWLLAASLVVGVAATMAQDLVPAAATLAPVAQRGKIVGAVMTGLLLGILLSRVMSGVVAQYFGWRAVFIAAALLIAMITLIIWRRLPRFSPTTTLSYPALMASMVNLLRRYKTLRRAALAQGLLSVGFSAFWSTLAMMLHDDFHLGSAAAGAFGLAGAAGALAARLAGVMADRRGAEPVTRWGSALATLSFAAMLLLPLLPAPLQFGLIVLSALGFDLGVQAALVAHQTIIYGLAPDARSQLNALLFTDVFIGMATGAALGSLIYAHFGWCGVVMLITCASGAGYLVRRCSRSIQH